MSQPRPDVHFWRTWRFVTADDTPIALIDPSAFNAAARLKAINVNPRFNAIVARFLGKDTDNDTATYKVSGFMDPDAEQNRTGAGPGAVLVSGVLTLGSNTGSVIPLSDGKWGAAATWFEVDTITVATNIALAVVKSGTNLQADLIVPTLGYNFLLLEVTNIGGGGTEMTQLGAMQRPLYVSGWDHMVLRT